MIAFPPEASFAAFGHRCALLQDSMILEEARAVEFEPTKRYILQRVCCAYTTARPNIIRNRHNYLRTQPDAYATQSLEQLVWHIFWH
jgi:hypothetical protein